MAGIVANTNGPCAGAYVIRNKEVSTVLHIRDMHINRAYTSSGDSWVVQARQQDECTFLNEQIWWIEPLAEYDGAEFDQDLVYSITNPASGNVLCISPSTGNTYAWPACGAPWETWRFRRVVDPEDGEVCYSMFSVFNDNAINIQDTNLGSLDNPVCASKFRASNRQQLWELVVPITSYPSGWLHIQNEQSRGFLSNDYIHNKPLLLPAPQPAKYSHYREEWGFQWALVQLGFFTPQSTSRRNSFCIVNRLTRVRLSPHFVSVREHSFPAYDQEKAWKLEVDESGKWKIRNIKTSCLLQQMAAIQNGMMAVGCTQQRLTNDGSQSWILRSPPQRIGEIPEPPPDYEAEEP